MRRGRYSDDEEDVLPKRARARGPSADDHHNRRHEPSSSKSPHPEVLLAGYIRQRQHAITALPAFVSDMKTGALTAPRLVGRGVCAGPSPSHVVKFEPLPSAVAGHARTVLSCAAAGPTPSAAEESSDAPQTPDLLAVLCAEPINGRTRVWVPYSSHAATEEGLRAINALPQVADLDDSDAPRPSRDTTLAPAHDAPAEGWPATDEELSQHVEACDRLIGAIELRLGLEGQAHAVWNDPTLPELTSSERLELRLLYLRRVHHFDALGGGSFATHTALLTSCGEAHVPARALIYAAQREPLAAPIRYSFVDAATRAQLDYVRSLDEIDREFEARAKEAAERFYDANCEEVGENKFRCPLSGKLFRDKPFVRKHIDNKFPEKLRAAQCAALDPKDERYQRANAERLAAMPRLPPKPRAAHRAHDGEGKGGRGRGFGERGGGRFGGGKGGGPPAVIPRTGPPPPPPAGAEVIGRQMVAYNDLDAPDDDELFS